MNIQALISTTNSALNRTHNQFDLMAAHLHKKNLLEASKYNLVDLMFTFKLFKKLTGNELYFLNIFGMLCRASQEATASILLLASDSEESHQKHCQDLIDAGWLFDDLHHAYHHEECAKKLKSHRSSWTNQSFTQRIKKTLGDEEFAFYRYASAFSHFAIPNEGYIQKHPKDFENIKILFLMKICKYIFLTFKLIVDKKLLEDEEAINYITNYLRRISEGVPDWKEFELDLIHNFQIFSPHTH